MRFRHLAGFGKRIEFWIIGEMLKQGLDVYIPLVDDFGIDAIVRRADGSFAEVQIKARSKDCGLGDAALFAGIPHELRDNYWFVFYSERMDRMWIMSSAEFVEHSSQNKRGKNEGSRSISLNGGKKSHASGKWEEYPRPQFVKFLVTDFNRLSTPLSRAAGA